MEWTKFSTHGESVNHAFEVMCNILFEIWCRDTYGENLIYFTFINGKGGDGGVEAYGLLKTGEVVSIQSKWFPQRLDNSQFKQIENSFYTAVKIRPALKKYIVCIPRDFTSEKMTKSNRVSKNTEETKWNNLCKKLKIEYPDIIIELWDETTIQKRLLSPKAIGCYKYWFENSVVFENEILNSYKKALNGWAKIKYIPDLYSKGHIHGILGNFVGIPEIIEQRYDELKKVISQLLSLKQAYKDILRLNLLKKELPLKRRIESDIKIVSEWILKFENDIPKIKNGDLIIEDFDLKKFKLNCTVSDFKEHPLHFQYYLNLHPVEELLDTIHDDLFKCWQLLGNKNDNRMIILGDPGTGKTSGIVGETNWFLQERIHLSIMVRAKDFTEGDSWLSIIVKTIGLSSSWSEQELLRALENATLLRSNQFDRTDDIKVQPMCLICVDGIDESANCDFWKEKIAEAKTYEKDFSRIKFVFLSRPYVFPRYYELDYRDCFSRIPSSGDVAVTDIFDDYVNYYNIDIGVNIWIRNALRTPIALRLFCDLYQNQKIDILPQNSLVLTSLFKKKMESLEITFGRIEGVANRHEMVKTLLITIADLLISQDKVCYEVIEKECTSIIRNHLEPLLDFVEKEGFVFSFIKGEDPFSILETEL